MRTLRNLLITVLLVVLAFLIYDNRVLIVQNLSKTLDKGETIVLPDNPTYKNNFEFEFVKETDDFTASSRQEILDILYTVLNNGLDNFTFYCDQNYGTCVSDFKEISQDQVLLSTINNMVSPFNSYNYTPHLKNCKFNFDNRSKIHFTGFAIVYENLPRKL